MPVGLSQDYCSLLTLAEIENEAANPALAPTPD
jgi:hypothetical protein